MNKLMRRICWMAAASALFFAACPRNAAAWDNGLAKTPPMGWNSWNKFACNVSEDLIKSVADAIASNGMKDAGYEYVVIDDCWQVSRDANGNIVADATRFPSGMKALADYVHSKGLKFGLYSDAGAKTCQGRPGSQG
ncbi:MAG TPA: glycoside hydrolase family 27 protein, partial [Terriglobales bacterium]|nr:glycoside hydrolase family 27 protein [Terriglobales bacterium]